MPPQTYGLEYDLDLFNIVAVDDFNMGAMENKSLNIFNSRLVMASPDTATDMDYSRIEGVVGHEYFHNCESVSHAYRPRPSMHQLPRLPPSGFPAPKYELS